jgi:hypothetical protein
MENSAAYDYVTEKLFQSLQAGSGMLGMEETTCVQPLMQSSTNHGAEDYVCNHR